MIAPATVMKTSSQSLPGSIREPRTGARLEHRGLFSRRLLEGETFRIRVLDGHLWVTLEGVREDHHLAAGEVRPFQGPGLLVAEAIQGAALFEISAAHPAQ